MSNHKYIYMFSNISNYIFLKIALAIKKLQSTIGLIARETLWNMQMFIVLNNVKFV